ncbi:MAG TPA: transketolase C-terminal domain-containing protein [Polyangia bacterium]|jgi:pyruvate dehydrogenase E1 component beta subunit|nr:transketolase C-terminal domain-containing protein [Polyangia bacterium]
MPEQVRELSYADAANAALVRALDERPETLVFGEDVGKSGGIFGVTKGLHRAFGDRVFDMPISESAILGGALGAALVGRRPIAEIMWVDFSLVALDQLVNQAANVRYLNRGRLTAPITVRTQQGSAPGACAQHSQSLEAIFAHIPGLQVCLPATAQDAYDLLLTAIWSDDPTIVIENRTLYHAGKVDVRTGGPIGPLGSAATRRPGRDATIVTWGAIQQRAIEAADRLAERGIETEVLDLRWLRPLDTAAILESVERTRRLVIVHEAHVTAGFGAEIAAVVAQSHIRLLAPLIRLGAPDVRIPAAVSLAEAVIPTAEDIESAVQRVVDSVAIGSR